MLQDPRLLDEPFSGSLDKVSRKLSVTGGRNGKGNVNREVNEDFDGGALVK